MNKILLIDVDGVAIKKHPYFSDRLAEKLTIPLERITPFFKGPFESCLIGGADLKEEITPYLADWGWTESVDALLAWWLEGENTPDQDVLTAVSRAKEAGTRCYLASNQEKYRSAYVMALIGPQFDGAFFSSELGVKKADPAFFQRVVDELGVRPEDIDYLDDEEKNLVVARGLGIKARVYVPTKLILPLAA